MAIGTVVWPSRAVEADETVNDRPPADDTFREMAELIREARAGMLVSGFTVVAVTVGVAVESAVLPVSSHAVIGTLVRLALLTAVAASVIRTAVLTLAAGRRLLDEVGELRRRTGAPVDPNVPWRRQAAKLTPSALGWDYMRVVLAAAHFRCARVNQALNWAVIAIICFCAWTLVSLILAGRL